MISDNHSVSTEDIAELVAANYEEVSPPRSIFESADITGRSLT